MLPKRKHTVSKLESGFPSMPSYCSRMLFSFAVNSKFYTPSIIPVFKQSNLPIKKIILRKSFSVLLNQAHLHRISLVTEFPDASAKTEAAEKIERVKWRQAVAVKQITQDAFLLRVCCVLFHNSKGE